MGLPLGNQPFALGEKTVSYFNLSGWGRGKKTEAAGTAILVMIPGMPKKYTQATFLRYTSGATEHTGTFMKGQSYATLTENAAASQAVVKVSSALLDGAGNAIAAGDNVAVDLGNGVWHLTTFSTASGLTYTLASNLPSAALKGAAIISYGIAGDSGHADYTFTLPAAATTPFPATANSGPLIRSNRKNEPILFSSNNTTNAGTIESISGIWVYE